jgi:ATP-dependent protease HslVU (ClpYQ) ATPase subunit
MFSNMQQGRRKMRKMRVDEAMKLLQDEEAAARQRGRAQADRTG